VLASGPLPVSSHVTYWGENTCAETTNAEILLQDNKEVNIDGTEYINITK
jgi:hypothetical protein